jgi:hypothetical protein
MAKSDSDSQLGRLLVVLRSIFGNVTESIEVLVMWLDSQIMYGLETI